MNKKAKKLIVCSTCATLGIYCANKILNYTATVRNLLYNPNGEYYNWKNGKIFYTVSGAGSPVLLIHDLHPASSSVEWTKVLKKLEKKYTVYTIDLLGCGRSEKPNITYTNYLFVQLLNDFVKDIIKEKTVVVSTGKSSSFSIMADIMDADNYKKVIVINPEDFSSLTKQPTKKELSYKHILDLPIFGTLLYNIEMSKNHISKLFRNEYYFNKSSISIKTEDMYFESAHIGEEKGRHLLSSIRSNYTNVNIRHAIPKIKNLCMITSKGRADHIKSTDEYTRLNDSIEAASISKSKYLPQLEVPDKFFEVLNMLIEK